MAMVPARWVATTLAAVLSYGCERRGGEREAPVSSAAAAQSAVPEGPKPPDLDAPQDLKALAVAALACPFSERGFDAACEGYKQWQRSDVPGEEENDAPLVAMLADERPAARYLAASALDEAVLVMMGDPVEGRPHTREPDLAAAVVSAAEKERHIATAERLGTVVGKIDLAEMELASRVEKVALEHPLPAMRHAVLMSWLLRNPQQLETSHRAFRAGDAQSRVAVVRGASAGFTKERAMDICALFLDAASDEDQAVAGWGADRLTYKEDAAACAPRWPELVEKLGQRARAGNVRDDKLVAALAQLGAQPDLKPATKAAAVVTARSIAQNAKNSGRAEALRFVGAHDPDAKAFAKSFESDPDAKVSESAKRILGG